MALLKKLKKGVKNYVGSMSGDLNSALGSLSKKMGKGGSFSNSFDQRISDGLSDLLTGATGIRTSNIPEITSQALSTKNANAEARKQAMNTGRKNTLMEGATPHEKQKLQFPENFFTEDNTAVNVKSQKDDDGNPVKGTSGRALTNYIHFRSLPLRNEKNGASGADTGKLYDIFLYVPEEMTDSTNANYEAAKKGMLETVMAKLFTFGEGTDQGIGDQMKQGVKEIFTGDIGKAATGRIVNPMKFNMFEGVDFRKFTYNWVLQPRNHAEAMIIREICHAFKYSSLPGIVPDSAGRVYTFPSEWAIRYHGPIKEWIDFPMNSVLESVEVNQSVAGSNRYLDGAPVATELKLSFMETLTLDKVKYNQRVSAFTQGTTNARENSQEGGSNQEILGRKDTDVNWANRNKDRVGMKAQNRGGQPVDDRGFNNWKD